MNSSCIFGLILFCMLCRPSLHESISDNIQDYGDDYEDEDYDYSLDDILNETETKKPSTTPQVHTTTRRPSTTESLSNIPNDVFIELPIKIYKCPQQCTCSYDFIMVNCSMQNLHTVPSDIPEVVEKLDLSKNTIEQLGEGDFTNYTNLKELILDSNKLTTISFKSTSGLEKLEYLSVVHNHLSQIDPFAFSPLASLKTLNLSDNSIIISATKTINGQVSTSSSFLNQPKLRELNLNGCNVHGVHGNMLKNTSELMALDLGNNEFDEPIDTQAFEPMKNLVKLKLPEVEQNTIKKLCKTLTAIDAISLPTYDVSCFELESGSSYDDSTIRTKPLAGVDDGHMPSNSDKDNKGIVKSVASRNEPGGLDRNGEKSINAEQEYTTRRNRLSAMEPARRNRTHSMDIDVNSTTPSLNQHTSDPDDEENYKVAISSQTINHILIGIIIVAVAGIIIGIVCRRDICGIKTKMCRTRRPPPTDQVRPAEEIPLNKV